MTDGYADDNNRLGIYFFGDSAIVPNEDEAGAIGLIFNTDDGVTGGSPGNDAQAPHFLDGGCIKFWINTHQS